MSTLDYHRGTVITLGSHCAGVGNAGATALAERLPTQRPSLHQLAAQRSLLRCCKIVLKSELPLAALAATVASLRCCGFRPLHRARRESLRTGSVREGVNLRR